MADKIHKLAKRLMTKLFEPQAMQEIEQSERDFAKEEVEITLWSQQGWRTIFDGTGRSGSIAEGLFKYDWEGDVLKAGNKAVGRNYVTERLPRDVNPTSRTHVLVREANYHPDGGQVFYPTDGAAFFALLALPEDDIKRSTAADLSEFKSMRILA